MLTVGCQKHILISFSSRGDFRAREGFLRLSAMFRGGVGVGAWGRADSYIL